MRLSAVPLALSLLVHSLPAAAEEGHVTFEAPGRYAHRAELLSEIPLVAPIDGVPADLGQELFGYHWLRLTPRLNWSEKIIFTGQIDLLRGAVWGDTADEVSADDSGRDDLEGYKKVQPRWLFAELRGPLGQLTFGQTGSQWGLGILANDGTHESLFGDPLYGDIVERILYRTPPIAIVPLESALVLAAGGDLVYRDNTADVEEGDAAAQGVLAAVLVNESEGRQNQIGTYAVYRQQTNEMGDDLRIVAVDLFFKHETGLPGASESAKASMAFEGVLVAGESTFLRSIDRAEQDVLQGGLAFILGAETRRLQAGIEFGWASGDADTLDDTVSRFAFDPDHNVGLVLFDEVMAWQTARSATLGANPEVAGRPSRGIGLLATNGAVSGTMYVNPTARLRLTPRFDVRAGLLIAQATSDVVDPFHQKMSGSPQNYRGGPAGARDLGVELDAGLRWERPLQPPRRNWGGVTLVAGLEGGVLLPGHAFDDAEGNRMDPVGMGRLRLGLEW
ncbi:MAG: hypothetical protein HYY06_07185 [Deltaproteobacteria bacterium]|nr:hypothetical protein [Deltaproteobacteria bacterium]